MKISYHDIKQLGPCYDPIKYLPDTWRGTVIDILKMTNVPAKDRLWVAVRSEFLNDQILHRHALSCARQCEKYADNSDVMYCNDLVEAFLDGHATQEELSAARSAAYSAARSAALEEQCLILIDLIERYS